MSDANPANKGWLSSTFNFFMHPAVRGRLAAIFLVADWGFCGGSMGGSVLDVFPDPLIKLLDPTGITNHVATADVYRFVGTQVTTVFSMFGLRI